jgi:hypothetical protein
MLADFSKYVRCCVGTARPILLRGAFISYDDFGWLSPESRTMAGIFISYRREDSIAHAGRIYDRLVTYFGQERVFMDIDTIDFGVDFVECVQQTVAACDVLIAVIGKHWLDAKDEDGRPRLENPEDFVRVEISAALERGVRVVPILVRGARMPRSIDLPEPMGSLARRNALEIPDLHFAQSVSRLIESLQRVVTDAEHRRQTEENAWAETERRRLAEEEKARAEAEQQRVAEDEKARAEAKQERLAEAEKARAEAEQRRLAEEKKARAEAEQRRLGEVEKARAEAGPGPLGDAIEAQQWLATLTTTLAASRTREFYIAPNIPPRISASATRSCEVPETETLVGVLDCSGIGIGTQAIVFGVGRLYYTKQVTRVLLSTSGYRIARTRLLRLVVQSRLKRADVKSLSVCGAPR